MNTLLHICYCIKTFVVINSASYKELYTHIKYLRNKSQHKENYFVVLNSFIKLAFLKLNYDKVRAKW